MLKSFLAFTSALALLALAPIAAAQQVAIPPLIRVIVPFGTGTSPDILARATAIQLATRLGSNVVVENRSGGSTMIGAAAVANGATDGSMLLITSSSTLTAAATLKSLSIDMERDLIPIAMIGDGPMFVAASAKSGIRSPADLVARARATPDTLTYGSAGVGSIAHLAMELFADAAKIQLRHIPYKSGAFALTDLNGGTLDLSLGSHTTFAGSVQAGRVFLIGLTSREPSATYPGLAPLASVTPGYAASNWVAAFAPARMPPALAQRLNREINEIAKSKEISAILQGNDAAAAALSLEELRAYMRDELANWKRLATAKKIQVE